MRPGFGRGINDVFVHPRNLMKNEQRNTPSANARLLCEISAKSWVEGIRMESSAGYRKAALGHARRFTCAAGGGNEGTDGDREKNDGKEFLT